MQRGCKRGSKGSNAAGANQKIRTAAQFRQALIDVLPVLGLYLPWGFRVGVGGGG